jgi:hypothetical protein
VYLEGAKGVGTVTHFCGNLSHNGELPRAGVLVAATRGPTVPPRQDKEVTCESSTHWMNCCSCRATHA